MRVIDHRTGRTVYRVASQDEALVALGVIVDERLVDAAVDRQILGFHNGRRGALRRTVRDAVTDTAVLGGALCQQGRDGADSAPWGQLILSFDSFTAANTTKWPVSVAELRTNSTLAECSIGDLAAHLNAQLRAELADVLTACADYQSPRNNDAMTALAWVCRGDLAGASLQEVTDMVRSARNSATALWDWTPNGGAHGDPFAVCAYAIGPLRYDIRLEAHELLDLHLAGNVDLALYRMIIDIGAGPTEVIWPAQNFACCDQNRTLTGTDQIPLHAPRWGEPAAPLVATSAQCRLCGATSYYSTLTRRALSDGSEPLGIVEEIDALPTATLTAIAAIGLHAVTADLPLP